MEKIIEVSPGLWVVILVLPPAYAMLDDGLITLRDDTGGNTLIDRAALPKLIETLRKVVEGELWETE